ncbi:MAG: NADH-quinone oxidoreductase subunit N [Deltaproteobacteria bacterium]|nr:NADH-quinone oxidoreductase subunit N [Deltaproteobacteria bacterium]
MDFTVPDVNIICMLPEILLLIFGTVLLFMEDSSERRNCLSLAAVGGILTAGLLIPFYWGRNCAGFDDIIVRDDIALLFQAALLIAVFLAIVFTHYYMRHRDNLGEYLALILTATAGMNVMVMTHNLLVVFLGMEILALSLYVLVGYDKTSREGIEATVKYFLLGAFSSAVFLLGIAFYYGATGRIGIENVSVPLIAVANGNGLLLLTGTVLVLAGLGFKIASVPFHMWAPDTYEGAPVSVASLLSVAPKIAAFAVFLRIALAVADVHPDAVKIAIVFMSCASMIMGNFTALRQTHFIRMLAYSGIAQVGYMLIGLLGIHQGGGNALVFYLIVYVFMNMGAFGVAIYLCAQERQDLRIDALSGLASRHPGLALAMVVFMISLAGLPPTAGFFAKFYVFKTGIEAGYLWLVLVAFIMTVVSLFYYFRVIMVMYMREATGEISITSGNFAVFSVIIGMLAFITLLLGIVPNSLVVVIAHALNVL